MPNLLPEIRTQKEHNYVAFFLTFACNLRCPYCINWHNSSPKPRHKKTKPLEAGDWIEAANRLVLRKDLPLTLQGGEPTAYKGFYRLVNEVKKDIQMDLLTNMMFDVDEFIRNVPVWRFNRIAPYGPIRVSYHPNQNDINDLIRKAAKLQNAGFKLGIYGILHPDENIRSLILRAQELCLKEGIDFRTKEFLGVHENKLYGTFKYPDSVSSSKIKRSECRTTEVIVDPSGGVYKCHSDLYLGRNPIANILDENFTIGAINKFRECSFYGDCNPCDVKVKTNRLQIFGHTSVEIRNIR